MWWYCIGCVVRLEDKIRIDNIREGGSIGNAYSWENVIRLKVV